MAVSSTCTAARTRTRAELLWTSRTPYTSLKFVHRTLAYHRMLGAPKAVEGPTTAGMIVLTSAGGGTFRETFALARA